MSDAVGGVFFQNGGFKETAYYRAADAVVSNEVSVIAQHSPDPVSAGEGLDEEMSPTLSSVIRFFIQESDVSDPDYGDEITYNNKVWRVREVETETGLHTLYCVGEERMIG